MTETPDEQVETPEPEAAAGEPAPRSPSRQRILLALAGVVVLLVGVGIGLLIQSSLADDSTAEEDQPGIGSVAVGFAQDMTRHHEQGVEMAQIEVANGADMQVRSLATDIMLTQTNEIGQMQSWLTRWGQPFINPGAPMTWMGHDMAGMGGMSGMPAASTPAGNHGDHGDMGDMPMPSGSMPMPSGSAPPMAPSTPMAEQPPMPGMATDGEMARLRSLHGAAADTYFLQLMLRHHEGGVHMMQYAADPANVSQDYVRNLAGAMLGLQGNEIETIKTMLAQRNAQPLPMN